MGTPRRLQAGRGGPQEDRPRAGAPQARQLPTAAQPVGRPDGDADLWWSVAFVYGELAKETGDDHIRELADWYYRYACFLWTMVSPKVAEQAIAGCPKARWCIELRFLSLGYPFEVTGPAAAGDIPTLRSIFREIRRRKVPTMLDL